MFTRKDAISAKEGMEQYRSPEMTLRVSGPNNSIAGVLWESLLTMTCRPAGVLALAPVIVAITRLVLVSYRLIA